MTDVVIDYSRFTGSRTAESDEVARHNNLQRPPTQEEFARGPSYFQKSQERERTDASSWSGASFGGGTWAGRSK